MLRFVVGRCKRTSRRLRFIWLNAMHAAFVNLTTLRRRKRLFATSTVETLGFLYYVVIVECDVISHTLLPSDAAFAFWRFRGFFRVDVFHVGRFAFRRVVN